jgi:hypothetical protein
MLLFVRRFDLKDVLHSSRSAPDVHARIALDTGRRCP